MVKVGLINNRHPMPVQNYIFEKEIENVFDFESIKKDYAEKYLQQVLDFEGGKYCIYLQRLTSPATLEAVGVCKGSSIKIFKNSDNNELFVICDE